MQMAEEFRNIALENSDAIVHMWVNEIDSMKDENYTGTVSDELFESTNREFVNVIFTSIKNFGDMKSVEEFSEKIINLGWPLSYITDGLQVFRRVTIDYILGQADEVNSDYITKVLNSVDEWVETIIRKLVNEYSGCWEKIISLLHFAI